MKLISLLSLFALASCSGFRYDMEMDLDLSKKQDRIKTTAIMPKAPMQAVDAAKGESK